MCIVGVRCCVPSHPSFGSFNCTVTAGVLRNERSRFQLFGDTMNTASRMQSTGLVNQIQVSEETAKLITNAGKEHWLMAREDQVVAKGKGMLSTFLLKIPGDQFSSDKYSEGNSSCHDTATLSTQDRNKSSRLIDWFVEVLSSLLKQVLLQRSREGRKVLKLKDLALLEATVNQRLASSKYMDRKATIRELTDMLPWPSLGQHKSTKDVFAHHILEGDEEKAELPRPVLEELGLFVAKIASLHGDHAFHNFEHAFHVAMSMIKFLYRLVKPPPSKYAVGLQRTNSLTHCHSSTTGLEFNESDSAYGIILTNLWIKFACVVSALIHGVDHRGVSNAQLVREGHELASRFHYACIAEQNALEISWNTLMRDQFKNLRLAIYTSETEILEFRHILFHGVLEKDPFNIERQAA